MATAVVRSGPGAAAPSAGMLVLGMHRSGTTALARVLAASGFDPGTRVIEGSLGNQDGHWEDAFAVELHERLLAEFGAAWNEPAPIPDGWASAPAAVRARAAIRTYLQQDRSRQPAWVLKDPRASLFAPLWIEEAARAGMPLGAVLMLRHPMEVAASLAARDGLSVERGLWLWLEYTASAAIHASAVPNLVLSYDLLLADGKRSLDLLGGLPGGELLAGAARAGQADAVLDAGLRHHAGAQAGLPGPIQDVWEALSAGVGKALDAQVVDGLFGAFHAMHALVQPLAADWRWRHRQLWERAARAEDLVARGAVEDRRAVEQLQELVTAQRRDVIGAFSSDIQGMQATTQEAIRAHAQLAGEYSELKRASELQIDWQGKFAEQQRASEQRELEWQGKYAELKGASDRQHLEWQGKYAALMAASERQQIEWQGHLARVREALAVANGELALLRERTTQEASRLAQVIDGLHAERDALKAAGWQLASANEALSASAITLETELTRLREATRNLGMERDAAAANASALASELVDLRDDHFQLRVRNQQLSEAAQTLAQVLQSRSWRWSRPFRVAMRLLGGRWGSEDRRKLRALFGREALVGTLELPEVSEPGAVPRPTEHALERAGHLAAADGRADVFVWSVIDWHFRTQRPQHLARAMSEQGHRVFYLSNNFEDSTSPGFRVEPLDASGRLFQVHLNLQGRPAIYHGMPDDARQAQLRASFACLLGWTRTRESLSIVHHPFWNALAMSCPDARVVYDCMDHHAGFDNNAPGILRGEADLIRQADLVVVTSDDLQERIGPQARNIAIVRNGCDFGFFSTSPAKVYREPKGRQVIGYFGAIAEWFDPELVRTVARAHPNAEVLLIGSDTSGVGTLLADEPNVRMVGEVPYAELPYWLHGFDVCILPFRVVPLTLATNPVKVYEYLAAGKPVVAVELPEMAQFGDLVSTAREPASFAKAVTAALADGSGRERRQGFAAGQTWAHRAVDFDQAVAQARDPRVSVIVLTYNNWAYTEACLHSLDASGDYGDLEIVVVDNASTDGTVDRLAAWQEGPAPRGQVRRLILNAENLGFAAGNNVGLLAASGEFLVLLNNDTYVTPGWVRTLCAHFRSDPRLGLLGPVTNNIGNEARIEIAYADMGEMVEQARRYTLANPGTRYPMRTVAFFCVAMPRRVHEAVGGLDERYGVGFFEDDDYCRRVEQGGWTIACADDVFVHHHLSASFDNMQSDAKRELFERNKQTYESRWGAWIPHTYRSARSKV